MKKITTLLLLLFALNHLNAQCWKIVSGKVDHSLALKTDSTLWAWGNNDYGTIGDGTYQANKIRPVSVDSSSKWLSVAAGSFFSIGIKSDGTLWTWGTNLFHELGDGSIVPSYFPKQVGTAANWKSVAAGRAHALALKTDGTLWAWGYNAQGQVGNGSGVGDVTTPVQIGTDNDWKLIEAGEIHSVAIKTNGTLWAWGYNSYGQVGNGGNQNVRTPTQIGTAADWQSVSAGTAGTLAIKTDGTLWAWGGFNQVMNFGNGTLVPTQVGTQNDWQSASCGAEHSLGLKADGTIWGWAGYTLQGNIGYQPIVPARIGTENDWKAVLAGMQYNIVLKTDNSLWSWGINASGQLGVCSTIDQPLPVLISCTSTCSPLPVSIISFKAKAEGTIALLSWQTALEQNIKTYEVERSSDGASFYTIGAVAPHNIASSIYGHADKQPKRGHNYYRLKIIDIDGSFKYSNIAELDFSFSVARIQVFPNPFVKNVFSVQTNFTGNKLDITISDLSGREMYNAIRSNNGRVIISPSSLGSGIYILKVSDGANTATTKIVRQ